MSTLFGRENFLEQKLQILEPNNRIIRVDSFMMTGGNNTIDNIKLTSK